MIFNKDSNLKVELRNIGKKYNGRWLFKGVDITLQSGDSLSVVGRNGSGKSTLLQIVFGLVQASEGVVLVDGREDFKPNELMAATSPSMELPMDFSLEEIHRLYLKLGKTKDSLQFFADYALFEKSDWNKPLKQFSSGMLQRLKTAFCLRSDAGILLLDEPLTNMDALGEKWFAENISKVNDRIFLVAGNTNAETSWTDRKLSLTSN